ncbi:peptidyl dipeptidase [Thraustotheca clavata]|uniref:Peptidyl dipeptidase n=1 Tax=Thraustotheca clavata TaxID=74557 RepID=A0A1W0A8L9_9STRA|nr:peptidyl dipeptidase [Thraustotheca clavata]
MNQPSNNPLLADWSDQPFNLPPFKAIDTCYFKPAIEVAQLKYSVKLLKILMNLLSTTPFGALLTRVLGVFYNLTLSCSLPEHQEVELELAGPMAAYKLKVTSFPGLFELIDAVYNACDEFEGEDLRLIERIHLDFVRSGALFGKEDHVRYKELMQKLAELTTKLTQNVMTNESEYTLELSENDLDGCPEDHITSAKQNAIDSNAPEGVYIVTLDRSMVEPIITYAKKREVRERVFRAFTSRGELSPERDNNALAIEILKLRIEQAKMHGYNTFADYQVSDTMEKTPQAVSELLNRVSAPAKEVANREREALEEYATSIGDSSTVEAWEWRYTRK